MPGERLSMRKIRELLRLRWEQHLPQRAISQSLRLSQASVSDYLNRARRAGLTWPLPDGLDDARLEALLFPPLPDVPSDQRPVPDWSSGAPRSTSAERDAGAAVGGIPRGDDRRVRLLLVLRSVSRMGRAAEADVAPGAHRRRAAVRRLRRSHHGGDRRGDRRDPACRDLRRRAGGVELHLRRSHRKPGAGRTGLAPTSTR